MKSLNKFRIVGNGYDFKVQEQYLYFFFSKDWEDLMSFSNEVDAIRWVNELIKKRQPYEYVRDL
jgi:hypothetical protein